jgi:ligand-binding SRPBCC domain-containing protein
LGVHHLARDQAVNLPQAQVFDFFATAANLARITPARLGFEFLEPPPEHLGVGADVRYRIRLNGVPVNWTSRIIEWDPPRRFADLQVKGPYHHWTHTHIFDADGDSRTIIRDRVEYEVPLGPLGEVARLLFVDRQLKAIFDFRAQAVSEALRGD